METQTYRFNKDKFTAEEAKKWLKDHNIKNISFEKAVEPKDSKTQKAQFCDGCHLNKVESHDVILQSLDRKVGKLKFPKEMFLPTVTKWDGIPMVFVPRGKPHLDPFRPIDSTTLKEVEGGIIGELSDPEVKILGHPNLRARENYTIDTAKRLYEEGKIDADTLERSRNAVSHALALMHQGKLARSTAFIAPDDGEQLTGPADPHHHLIFEEFGLDMPVDPGAAVLNKQEIETVTPKLQKGAVISAKNKGRLQSVLDQITTIFTEAFGDTEQPVLNASMVIAAGGRIEMIPGSLEDRIQKVGSALTKTVDLKYPDGTPRCVWSIVTLPDKVIWQNPETNQYFSTPYTMEAGEVVFGEPTEVEQEFIIKTASPVLNMTSGDFDRFAKLNKELETRREDEHAGGESLTVENIGAGQEQKMTVEEQKMMEEKDAQIAALEAKIAELEGSGKKQKEELDAFRAEQELAKTQKEDADWTALKATVIPPGLVKTPEDEAALRKLQKEDNAAFVQKVAVRADPKKSEGASHTQKIGDMTPEEKAAERSRILSKKVGIPGTFH